MTRQEPHYKKKWKGMAESTVNYGRPVDETNSINNSINKHNKLMAGTSCHLTQERKPESSSLLKLTLREQSLSSSSVDGNINNRQILNHSSRNSAFQPVGPKQKG